MKQWKMVLWGLMAGCLALVAETRNLTMIVNSIITQELPFAIEKIDLGGKDNVIAEIDEHNRNNLWLRARKAGNLEIQVSGLGGLSQKFSITVYDDKLQKRLEDLKLDLDKYRNQLQINIRNDRLKVEGVVNTLQTKRELARIFRAYGDVIWDMTTFALLPEIKAKLKNDLAEKGYNVLENKVSNEVGELTLKTDGEKIFLSGQIYSEEDEKRIREVLDSETWLVDGKQKQEAKDKGVEDDRISYALNLRVVETVLQVDVLHVAVTEAECKRIGVDWGQFFANGASITANVFKEITHDLRPSAEEPDNGHYAGSSVKAHAGLTATLGLLGSNDIHRIRRSASMTFKNNGKAKMHSGGSVEINNTNTGGNNVIADTKTIEYGLKLEVSGGLSGKDTVNLDLLQSISYPLKKEETDYTYEERKSSFSMPLKFKLGQAIAIGSASDIQQDITNTASMPYIRNVPFLKWLVSQNVDEYEEVRIITLVSVRTLDSYSTIDPIGEELEKMHLEDDARQKEHDQKETKEPESKWYQFWKW